MSVKINYLSHFTEKTNYHSWRYSIVDLTKLLERTQDYRAMSQDDLGIYYRRFLSIADYLIKEDRLSERERNAFYLKGFPQPIQASIKKRLEIKCPDVRPADGYKLSDIHDAASFAVTGHIPGFFGGK